MVEALVVVLKVKLGSGDDIALMFPWLDTILVVAVILRLKIAIDQELLNRI